MARSSERVRNMNVIVKRTPCVAPLSLPGRQHGAVPTQKGGPVDPPRGATPERRQVRPVRLDHDARVTDARRPEPRGSGSCGRAGARTATTVAGGAPSARERAAWCHPLGSVRGDPATAHALVRATRESLPPPINKVCALDHHHCAKASGHQPLNERGLGAGSHRTEAGT